MTDQLKALSEFTEKAHARIQKDFANINPVVGVSQKLRSVGFPADVMTIDCLASGKRIIVILHDDEPDIVKFQFCFKDKDPSDNFDVMAFSELSENQLYDWIKTYFS